MKKNIVMKSVGIVALLVVGTAVLYFVRASWSDGDLGYRDEPLTPEQIEERVVVEEPQDQGIVAALTEKVTRRVEEIKNEYVAQPEVLYAVPFTSQAPYANWEPPYDEACEEASMLMVSAYFNDETLSPSIADASIQAQYAWQTENGYPIDINVAEVVEVLDAYFELDSQLMYNPTVEQLQQALDEGSLIIAPAAGQLLGNPYFTPPGPVYHMFVITGYDSKREQFITNDPGTRRGEKYRYDFSVLMNALHDWNGGDVLNGQKVVVVVPAQ